MDSDTEPGKMAPDKMPSTSESRKLTKPVMEKKRRARINASLAELKSLLLEVMKKEGTHQHKLEKADILEITVRHLRQLKRQQLSVTDINSPHHSTASRYRLGFNECANEVRKFLESMDDIETEIQARILHHLHNCEVAYDINHMASEKPTEECQPSTISLEPVCAPKSNFDTPGEFNLNLEEASVESRSKKSIFQPNICERLSIAPPTSKHFPNISTDTIVPCQPYGSTKDFIATQTIQIQIPQSQPAKIVPDNSGTESVIGSYLMPVQPHLQMPSPIQIPNMGSVPLIPTKLESGEMAYIIPANVTPSVQPNFVIPIVNSAAPMAGVIHPPQTHLSFMNKYPVHNVGVPLLNTCTPGVLGSSFASTNGSPTSNLIISNGQAFLVSNPSEINQNSFNSLDIKCNTSPSQISMVTTSPSVGGDTSTAKMTFTSKSCLPLKSKPSKGKEKQLSESRSQKSQNIASNVISRGLNCVNQANSASSSQSASHSRELGSQGASDNMWRPW